MTKEELESISRKKLVGNVKFTTHQVFSLIALHRDITIGEILDEIADKLIEETPIYKQWLSQHEKK